MFVYGAQHERSIFVFYEQLLKRCNELGLGPTRLIEGLGMSSGNLSKWKNGTIPNGEVLKAIAHKLDCTVDYLLGNDEKAIDDNYIKFAMFGTTDVSDEEFEDVKRYAQFIKDRKKNESK